MTADIWREYNWLPLQDDNPIVCKCGNKTDEFNYDDWEFIDGCWYCPTCKRLEGSNENNS